jgi:uncharacterized protein (TIGR03435 family)
LTIRDDDYRAAPGRHGEDVYDLGRHAHGELDDEHADSGEPKTLFMDHPVFDKTGLKGNYQIGLDLSMEDMMNLMSKNGFSGGWGGPPGGVRFGPNPFAGGGADSTGSSVLLSIQQLGLKLEPQKAPMPMLVIDHLEKTPVEN